MFKSCCARPNKKLVKSKSKSEKMDTESESDAVQTKEKLEKDSTLIEKNDPNNTNHDTHIPDTKNADLPPVDEQHEKQTIDDTLDHHTINEKSATPKNDDGSESPPNSEQKTQSIHDSPSDMEEDDALVFAKREITKKRYSMDYKSRRLDFKRFSVDCRRDSVTLEELARLEQELAKSTFAVRPVTRRKSTGILKSTTSSSNSVVEQRVTPKQPSESDEDDEVFEVPTKNKESEGPREPPATPVGRDELAMRRHRFFSDLVCAARAAVEHRVRFDPLGPVVADGGKIMFLKTIQNLKSIPTDRQLYHSCLLGHCLGSAECT